jgi:hypothetical protein
MKRTLPELLVNTMGLYTVGAWGFVRGMEMVGDPMPASPAGTCPDADVGTKLAGIEGEEGTNCPGTDEGTYWAITDEGTYWAG